MRIAAYAKSGAATSRPMAAKTTSTLRFMTKDDRESRAGGTQTSGIPSSRCMLARGPMSVEEPRHDVDDHVAVAQRPNDVHRLRCPARSRTRR